MKKDPYYIYYQVVHEVQQVKKVKMKNKSYPVHKSANKTIHLLGIKERQTHKTKLNT